MIRDVRLACRAIARMPVVAATIVLSLAAGIGANVVAFSWLEARVLHPLPGVANAAAFHQIEPRHRRSGVFIASSWLEYQDLRRELSTFADLVAFRATPLYVGEAGDVERPYGQFVSPNFFDALAVEPALGRGFVADGSDEGGLPVVVISDAFWQSRFGGTSDVVGRTIRVNGVPLTVVGVTPPGFQGPVLGIDFQLWIPASQAPVLQPGSQELDARAVRGYLLMGRLADGVTRAQAASDVAAVMRELERRHPDANGDVEAEVLPFWDSPRGPQRMFAQVLVALQGLMLLLLLAVCGNVANLLLARASRREREMAIRAALGGGRIRLARLILAESAVLSLAGALVGAALSVWGTRAFWALPITSVPIRLDSSVTGAGVGLALVLGLLTGLLCGAAPAVQLARTSPAAASRGSGRLGGPGRLGRAMTGVQMALALVVLVIAALFVRQFDAARTADPGFRRDGVLLLTYDLAGLRPTDTDVRAWTADMLDRVRRVPGVSGAAATASVPLDIHGLPSRTFVVEGRPARPDQPDRVLTNVVTPGYFDVMDIDLVDGQPFSPFGAADAPVEAVINDAFVARYLEGLTPLGRNISVQGQDAVVAGVVRTTRSNTVDELPTPAVYFSYRDRPVPAGELHVVTEPGREHEVAQAVRDAIGEAYPEVPVFQARSMAEHIDSNLVLVSVPARMFSLLAPLLLLLAAAGITAVVSHATAARTAEVGIRIALGATPGRIVRGFLGDSLGPIASGLVVGWSVALLAAAVLVPGTIDATIFAGVPALLLAVALAAAWWPAWKAAHRSPVAALASRR